jgi:hypothetical protein
MPSPLAPTAVREKRASDGVWDCPPPVQPIGVSGSPWLAGSFDAKTGDVVVDFLLGGDFNQLHRPSPQSPIGSAHRLGRRSSSIEVPVEKILLCRCTNRSQGIEIRKARLKIP